MNDASRRQLSALAHVAEVLSGAKIDYWLFGGWAVDFHAGAVTRSHDDLDIAVWLADFARIKGLLEVAGWQHVPSSDDDGGTGFEQKGIRLELTFLVRADDGGVYVPLREGRGAWPRKALGDRVLELLGTRAQVISLSSLVESKSVPRADLDDALKDRADHEVLRRVRDTRG